MPCGTLLLFAVSATLNCTQAGGQRRYKRNWNSGVLRNMESEGGIKNDMH